LSCSFGLFGLSGLSRSIGLSGFLVDETNQMNQINQINQINSSCLPRAITLQVCSFVVSHLRAIEALQEAEKVRQQKRAVIWFI